MLFLSVLMQIFNRQPKLQVAVQEYVRNTDGMKLYITSISNYAKCRFKAQHPEPAKKDLGKRN